MNDQEREEWIALLNFVDPVDPEDSLGFLNPVLREHFARRLHSSPGAQMMAGLLPAPAKERGARRTRRMTPARALKEAAKAGNVAAVTIDNATFTLGAVDAATTSNNPWDEVLRFAPDKKRSA
jgi:hypothetical protein